jgi:hypothetical protein
MQSNIMSDAEQHESAERLFQRDYNREEIKEAIKLEEERRAAIVKNLYRLRALRLEARRKTNATAAKAQANATINSFAPP